MKKTEIFLPDADSTRALGSRLAMNVVSEAIVLLKGELGAGKTTLVQGIGQGLGIIEPVNSPTFTMLNEYTSGRLPLYHLDLYRIHTSGQETAALEFLQFEMHEYLSSGGIVVIEWADPIEQYLPGDRLKISLRYTSFDSTDKIVDQQDELNFSGRHATITALGTTSEKLAKALM